MTADYLCCCRRLRPRIEDMRVVVQKLVVKELAESQSVYVRVTSCRNSDVDDFALKVRMRFI